MYGEIDVRLACNAEIDYVESGTALLVVRLKKGENQQLAGYTECGRENNEYVTTIHVECQDGEMQAESFIFTHSGTILLFKNFILKKKL